MPIEPTVVRVESISTSSEKTSPSGVSTSAGNLACAIIFLAASTTSSIVPFRKKALSGTSSCLPSMISSKPLIVSAIGT